MKHISGEARVRVRYAETDQMGVVYHANYLVWFEVGRVELLRQRGLIYKDLEHKTVDVHGWQDAEAAYELVSRAQRAFVEKKGK